MNHRYVFDVDGTLTPSRQKILPEMETAFNKFIDNYSVYLVTGSDYEKTLEQLGKNVIEKVEKVYNCSGSDVWAAGKNIKKSEWVLPFEVRMWLEDRLTDSLYPVKTGLHIEQRTGLCNFSIVGRRASQDQRQDYVKYDKETKDRDSIVKDFNNVFCNVIASAGGETGVDIHPVGKDKSQIVEDFNENDVIHFFGDRMDKDGNDHTLALKANKSYPVKSWEDTYNLIVSLNQLAVLNGNNKD